MNNPSNQGNQTKKQQDASGSDLKRIKISIDALTNEIQTQRREQAEREKKNKWPKQTAIAAIIYTGLTFVIMLIYGYQNYLIRSNNVESERAFISVRFQAGPTAYSDTTTTQWNTGSIMDAVTQGGSDIANVSLIAEITNSGNTPTKNLTTFMKCAPSPERLQDPWSILYQGVNNPKKIPQFVGAHGTAQISCGFTGDQIRAIKRGSEFGYIMLDANYQDRLTDDWHKTQSTVTIAAMQFVPAIEPNGLRGVAPVFVLSGYGRHNCADDECPE